MPKGIKGFQKGHPTKGFLGRHHKEESKIKIGIKVSGENNGMWGKKRPDLITLNKSRIGIPIKEESKEKQKKKILKYWQSLEGEKQKEKLSLINKKWAENNPDKKLQAAKKGHKACPRISSLELIIQDALKKQGIGFTPQYEWKRGFIDIFIEPNIAIFIDGDYWHNLPNVREKDKMQDKNLVNNGFVVYRFWEHQIKANIEQCLNPLNQLLGKN